MIIPYHDRLVKYPGGISILDGHSYGHTMEEKGMRIAEQMVKICCQRDVEWMSLREFLLNVKKSDLTPYSSHSIPQRYFFPSGVVKISPDPGRLLTEERDKKVAKMINNNVAFVYTSPQRGILLVLPEGYEIPVKHTIEMNIHKLEQWQRKMRCGGKRCKGRCARTVRK